MERHLPHRTVHAASTLTDMSLDCSRPRSAWTRRSELPGQGCGQVCRARSDQLRPGPDETLLRRPPAGHWVLWKQRRAVLVATRDPATPKRHVDRWRDDDVAEVEDMDEPTASRPRCSIEGDADRRGPSPEPLPVGSTSSANPLSHRRRGPSDREYPCCIFGSPEHPPVPSPPGPPHVCPRPR